MTTNAAQFRCPSCQEERQISRELAGRRVSCPSCGHVTQLATTPLSSTEEPAVSFAGDNNDSTTDMDMTPMVDVTFLLLIFFMVTAAFTLQRVISMPSDSNKPSPQHRDLEDSPFVEVHIDSNNTYFVRTPKWEEEAPSEHEMLVQVRRAKEGDGGQPPIRLLVEAHGDALHEKVVAAIDAGTVVGFETVSVAMTESSYGE